MDCLKSSFSVVLFLLSSILIGVNAKKRTINSPCAIYQLSGTKLNIDKVVMTDAATFIYVHIREGVNNPNGKLIGCGAYLEDENGYRYRLTRVDAHDVDVASMFVAIEPARTCLAFEPLPLTTKLFDLHVNDWYTPLHIYGIHDKKSVVDIPDLNATQLVSMTKAKGCGMGKVVVKGKIDKCVQEAQPVLYVAPFFQTDNVFDKAKGNNRFCLLKNEDGAFEREIDLPYPMLTTVKIDYKHKYENASNDYLTHSFELLWLEPGDTAEIVVSNMYGESHNVEYPRQTSIAQFLNNAPMALYYEMATLQSMMRSKTITEAKLDSVEQSLAKLRNYLVWKYKMNDAECSMLSDFMKKIVSNSKVAEPMDSTISINDAIDAKNLDGYDVLQSISSHLLGKYVVIHFFNSQNDLKEVENLIEDFKDSEDFAFVFVACDSFVASKNEYDMLRRSTLKDCKDCHMLSEKEYNKLMYIAGECTGYQENGMTLNRMGKVMRIHQPLGNEYQVRCNLKSIIKEESY